MTATADEVWAEDVLRVYGTSRRIMVNTFISGYRKNRAELQFVTGDAMGSPPLARRKTRWWGGCSIPK